MKEGYIGHIVFASERQSSLEISNILISLELICACARLSLSNFSYYATLGVAQ